MPRYALPEQNGNSCAAHCTIVAVAELGWNRYLSERYAEKELWPRIKFVADGTALIDALALAENSDPRRIATEAAKLGPTATLRCDEAEKITAMGFVTDVAHQVGLTMLFNVLKGVNATVAVALDEGVYYNCSFLMLPGPVATPKATPGMHNILVTKSNGIVYYYNPNESVPAWNQVNGDWKTLNGQNGNQWSYVFTGVFVEMRA